MAQAEEAAAAAQEADPQPQPAPAAPAGTEHPAAAEDSTQQVGLSVQ